MSDELDEAEKTRLALTAQVQRLESVVAKLEAELEEDDNPATRRRYEASVQKLAEVQAQLAPLAAKNESQAFDDLQKAMNAGLEDQLAALRHVWRKHRHPRVADLIDILSAELLSTLPPIPTSELPALFARRDPTEVSRLLTMPWPTTREVEELVVQAILWLPDDPRVASICAREIDLQRIGRGYYEDYGRLYERLTALGDVRQLPLLEKQNERPRRTHELDRQAVAAHRKLKPELPPEFEPLIQTLEDRWADWVERRDARKRQTQEHLDRVLAEPHETSHRLVFADWLAELGDPRGEFINLQLGPQSDESRRRQEDLIAAYWSEWCRPILDGLASAPRFEGGFPAAGELGRYHRVFTQPEWRTFTSLTLVGAIEPATVVREPNLLSLRELRGVHPALLKGLLNTKAPLVSIALHRRYGHPDPDEQPITRADFAAMPTLERLELEEQEARAWVNAFVSLKFIRVRVERATAEEFISLMEAGPIDVLEVMLAGATIRLERSERGEAFTRATVLSGNRHLLDCLPALPRTLTSLTSHEPAVLVTQAWMEELKQKLGRFPALVMGELPMRARPARRYFRLETERIIGRREAADLLARRFELQFDHVVGPSWDDRREYWTELGERGEPTLLKNEESFTAVLPVLEPKALSDALKAFVNCTYSRVTTLSLEGRELRTISGEWPALEQFEALLKA